MCCGPYQDGVGGVHRFLWGDPEALAAMQEGLGTLVDGTARLGAGPTPLGFEQSEAFDCELPVPLNGMSLMDSVVAGRRCREGAEALRSSQGGILHRVSRGAEGVPATFESLMWRLAVRTWQLLQLGCAALYRHMLQLAGQRGQVAAGAPLELPGGTDGPSAMGPSFATFGNTPRLAGEGAALAEQHYGVVSIHAQAVSVLLVWRGAWLLHSPGAEAAAIRARMPAAQLQRLAEFLQENAAALVRSVNCGMQDVRRSRRLARQLAEEQGRPVLEPAVPTVPQAPCIELLLRASAGEAQALCDLAGCLSLMASKGLGPLCDAITALQHMDAWLALVQRYLAGSAGKSDSEQRRLSTTLAAEFAEDLWAGNLLRSAAACTLTVAALGAVWRRVGVMHANNTRQRQFKRRLAQLGGPAPSLYRGHCFRSKSEFLGHSLLRCAALR